MSQIEITGTFKFLGVSDEVTTCDCCGKPNLKSTVAFDLNGDVVHYGSTCAARHTGRKTTVWVSEKKIADEAIRKQVRIAIDSTPERRAYLAKCTEAHALRIPPGKAFKEYVSALSDQFHAVEARMWAESGVSRY